MSFYEKHVFVHFSSNFRPSLTRAETIESCNSDDLVTVLEMHNRKPYKVIDRNREVKKGVMAESLEELISRGKDIKSLNFNPQGRSIDVKGNSPSYFDEKMGWI